MFQNDKKCQFRATRNTNQLKHLCGATTLEAADGV